MTENRRRKACALGGMGFLFMPMRYHYEFPKKYSCHYGRTYICDHPVYKRCTLFEVGGRGLAVIQQRYDPQTKCTWWGSIDPWLCDDLYLHGSFKAYFDQRAGMPADGVYPTVTIRQIMWALKMKPLPKGRWETVFDRKEI